eukprot:403368014
MLKQKRGYSRRTAGSHSKSPSKITKSQNQDNSQRNQNESHKSYEQMLDYPTDDKLKRDLQQFYHYQAKYFTNLNSKDDLIDLAQQSIQKIKPIVVESNSQIQTNQLQTLTNKKTILMKKQGKQHQQFGGHDNSNIQIQNQQENNINETKEYNRYQDPNIFKLKYNFWRYNSQKLLATTSQYSKSTGRIQLKKAQNPNEERLNLLMKSIVKKSQEKKKQSHNKQIFNIQYLNENSSDNISSVPQQPSFFAIKQISIKNENMQFVDSPFTNDQNLLENYFTNLNNLQDIYASTLATQHQQTQQQYPITSKRPRLNDLIGFQTCLENDQLSSFTLNQQRPLTAQQRHNLELRKQSHTNLNSKGQGSLYQTQTKLFQSNPGLGQTRTEYVQDDSSEFQVPDNLQVIEGNLFISPNVAKRCIQRPKSAVQGFSYKSRHNKNIHDLIKDKSQTAFTQNQALINPPQLMKIVYEDSRKCNEVKISHSKMPWFKKRTKYQKEQYIDFDDQIQASCDDINLDSKTFDLRNSNQKLNFEATSRNTSQKLMQQLSHKSEGNQIPKKLNKSALQTRQEFLEQKKYVCLLQSQNKAQLTNQNADSSDTKSQIIKQQMQPNQDNGYYKYSQEDKIKIQELIDNPVDMNEILRTKAMLFQITPKDVINLSSQFHQTNSKTQKSPASKFELLKKANFNASKEITQILNDSGLLNVKKLSAPVESGVGIQTTIEHHLRIESNQFSENTNNANAPSTLSGNNHKESQEFNQTSIIFGDSSMLNSNPIPSVNIQNKRSTTPIGTNIGFSVNIINVRDAQIKQQNQLLKRQQQKQNSNQAVNQQKTQKPQQKQSITQRIGQ